jgi:hypothetical protein
MLQLVALRNKFSVALHQQIIIIGTMIHNMLHCLHDALLERSSIISSDDCLGSLHQFHSLEQKQRKIKA